MITGDQFQKAWAAAMRTAANDHPVPVTYPPNQAAVRPPIIQQIIDRDSEKRNRWIIVGRHYRECADVEAYAKHHGFCLLCLWPANFGDDAAVDTAPPQFVRHKSGVLKHRWRNDFVVKQPLPAPELPTWDGIEQCDAVDCNAPATHYTPRFERPLDKLSRPYVLWAIYASRQNKAWCGGHKYKLDKPIEIIDEPQP
jgi:hypothetical protein